MPLCPEVVRFTCTAINLDSGTLRWFHDGIDFPELTYIYQFGHMFPRQVYIEPVFREMGFLHLMILRVEMSSMHNFKYYTPNVKSPIGRGVIT